MESTPVYIFSLRLDPESQAFFDELRARYFPPERNFLSAHITLFHALPEAELARIEAEVERDLRTIAAEPITIGAAYLLGNGVAYPIVCPRLAALREEWRRRWQPFLTRQDQAPKKLHLTIQNKVAPQVARQTLKEVEGLTLPSAPTAGVIELSLYAGGPWRLRRSFSL